MLTYKEAEGLALNDESAECAGAGISFVNVRFLTARCLVLMEGGSLV